MRLRREPIGLQEVVNEATEIQREYDGDHRGLPLDEAVVVWRHALEVAVDDAWSMLLRVRDIAHSPIEEMFLAALWVVERGDRTAINEEGSAVAWASDPSAHEYVTISAQEKIGAYFADFVVRFSLKKGVYPKFPDGKSVLVVVELDGHDFHEKTKAQAAHDKKRDRYFAAQGLTVLRFTGSEVHRDAYACATEVRVLLGSKMTEEFAR